MTTIVTLSPYAAGELSEILAEIQALQHRLVPDHARWSLAEARSELSDLARGHGAHVLVARRGDAITGVVGWVALGAADGEFYAAPLLAEDEDTAARLLDAVIARARATPARWIRTGAWPAEAAKLRVLVAAGFVHVFDFVSLRRDLPAPIEAPAAIPGLHPVARADIDHARFAALHNECFRDIPNSPPIDAALSREVWDHPASWRSSLLLADEHGAYKAFLLAREDGFLEGVGVAEELRGRGVARAMVRHAMALVAAHGVPALTSLCASTNVASLALHHSLGFAEVARRQSWQLDLPQSP